MRELLLIICLALTPAAFAVMSGGWEPPAAEADDPDYAAGLDAFTRQDWPAVITHMEKALQRRPWNDNAQNLLGFAYRKLGDYDRAFEHYGQALDLNPYHRGALEYLGEAYLELDQPAKAQETLQRLGTVCERVDLPVASGACSEWEELNAAVRNYTAHTRSGD